MSVADTKEFLGLRATHNPHRWVMPVVDKVRAGGGSLFGGAALAAGMIAMEETAGRPVVWATAQYLSFVQPPSILDIDVIVPTIGNNVTQARAVLHVDDKEIITVNAALGSRDMKENGYWVDCPDAKPPEDCEKVDFPKAEAESIHDRIDLRVARGKFGFRGIGDATDDGRSLLWCRIPEAGISAGSLAIMADFMPSGIGNVLDKRAGGSSLDNTIRIVNVVPTEWVLCDIHVHGLYNGFGHGLMHLWSDSGTLMATASQSVIARIHK